MILYTQIYHILEIALIMQIAPICFQNKANCIKIIKPKFIDD